MRFGRQLSGLAIVSVLLATSGSALVQDRPQTSVDPSLFASLRWRSIGPARGGRSQTVAGSVARPMEYYFGAVGGGVWKTTDGGINWRAVSDRHFKSSSVGAIGISESNPDVVYVGMGETQLRGNIIQGDGVYKTTDAGRTWTHVGLEKTMAIARLRVHPANPEIAYAAALGDPYGATADRGVFKTTDGGKSWKELPALRQTKSALWQPGAGGMGLHTILLDPRDEKRITIAISAAGAFRTDDGGLSWKPINKGLKSQFELPDPDAEVGHCVHRIAAHRSRPDVLYMQKHWDIMRSDNAGDLWSEVSGNLPTDFGFPIDVHAHEPDTVYVVPITSDSLHYPPEGKLRVYRSRSGGNEWEPLTKGLPQENCYVNVLRDAMSVDSLDSCGIYFGTTGGQVYASTDAGDSWSAIVRDLPAVVSVEVQTLS
jgi:hypothetical protein